MSSHKKVIPEKSNHTRIIHHERKETKNMFLEGGTPPLQLNQDDIHSNRVHIFTKIDRRT